MFIKKTLQKGHMGILSTGDTSVMVIALPLARIISSENTWRHKKQTSLNVMF